MEFIIEAGVLQRAVKQVKNNTSRSMPILGYVRMEALPDGKLELYSTDLDSQTIVSIKSVDVKKVGDVLFDVKKFSKLINSFGRELLSIVVGVKKGVQTLFITGKGTKLSLFCDIDPAGFPAMIKTGQLDSMVFNSSVFSNWLSRISFASGIRDFRAFINGIYLGAGDTDSDKKTIAVAMNGHIMAYSEVESPPLETIVCDESPIVPISFVNRILSLLKDVDGDCRFLVGRVANEDGSFLSFNFGINAEDNNGSEVSCFVRGVQGSYPDFHLMVPSTGELKSFTIGRDLFYKSLQDMFVLNDTKENGIPSSFNMKIDGDVMYLSFVEGERGNGWKKVDIDGGGFTFDATYNTKYVLNAVEHIQGKKVLVDLWGEGVGCLIKEETDGEFGCFVMPVSEV